MRSKLIALVIAGSLSGEALAQEGADRLSAEVDRLAPEVERWSAYVRDNPSKDELWTQIKEGAEPALRRTEKALRDGRRLLALQRLAAIRGDLAASVYVASLGDAKTLDEAAFEAEWKRVGALLAGATSEPRGAFDGVVPAAVRAVGEAALPQAKIFHEASLEYGRSTQPVYGLHYLGTALAQRDFASFCRTLSTPGDIAAAPAPVRRIDAEIDALEREVLAAYRPPASLDKHGVFIGVSAALKEARELTEQGLLHGALLRYLQAALRFAPLRAPSPAAPDRAASTAKLQEASARLHAERVDHSLGQLFVEAAEEDLADPATPGSPSVARAVLEDVLPRYVAALRPAAPAPRGAPPVATVTLVRWPFT